MSGIRPFVPVMPAARPSRRYAAAIGARLGTLTSPKCEDAEKVPLRRNFFLPSGFVHRVPRISGLSSLRETLSK
jgi:hypothetical protein